jgi:hypothetical protein
LDPFFSHNGRLTNLYDWYRSKNPNFLPMSLVNPEMPEFEILIAGIVKDLYILSHNVNTPRYTLKNLNKNSKNREAKISEIQDILLKCNDIIQNKYKYIDVIDCILRYLNLFNSILLSNHSRNCNDLALLKELPYILYPSFHQIDIYKVNLTLSAPFINFLLTNNIHYSHNSLQTVCYEIYHDIKFHYGYMMINFFALLAKTMKGEISRENKQYALFLKTYSVKNKNNFEKISEQIGSNRQIFKQYFDFTNDIIQKLSPILIYKRSKGNNYASVYSINQCYMNSILLFLIFHENFFFSLFFEEGESLHTLINEIKKNNPSNNESYYTILYKYFKENFYKICRNSIISEFNNNQLDIDFEILIEKNFGIEINPENISEILGSYKKSGEEIYQLLFHDGNNIL